MKGQRQLYQTDQSYLNSLHKIERRANNGTPLKFYDCEDIGNKNTECILGLCDDSIQRAQDGIYQAAHHHCPHDGAHFEVDGTPKRSDCGSSGCFYRCHIFKGKHPDSRKREVIVMRIVSAIKEAPIPTPPSNETEKE